MFGKTNWIVRPADHQDMKVLSQLVHFDAYVHRHLDYREPLEWIGSSPFLVLERDGKIESTLVCPPDPPRVAWIKLFAASRQIRPQKAWELVWSEAKDTLFQIPGVQWSAAIPLQNWFTYLLENSGFEVSHHIVMMKWQKQPIQNGVLPPGISVRPMTLDDLEATFIIDQSAFVPVWQNSIDTLEIAFRQAGIASVALIEGQVAGYQISTPTHMGGHLARLAVLPEFQGKGLGTALLSDLLVQFSRRGALVVTVNTQKDNQVSLSLYKKAGFIFSGEEYPIYQYEVQNPQS
jgi:ribosomal protein S18 acetylase RimI-like enzyme